MRTSLNEIKRIEDHLHGEMSASDQLLFEAYLTLDKELQEKISWQKKVYGLIRVYGRKKLKLELEAIHHKLFNNPEHSTFRKSVLRFFPNHQ